MWKERARESERNNQQLWGFMFKAPAEGCFHAVSGACHSRNALTPPYFFLFRQFPPHPHLTPIVPLPASLAWVMACVDFLSLGAVVPHGLALSSCFHACPFNQPGNPSWYLYRPRFSWCRCSLPSLIPCNLPLSPSLPSLRFSGLGSIESHPALFIYLPGDV